MSVEPDNDKNNDNLDNKLEDDALAVPAWVPTGAHAKPQLDSGEGSAVSTENPYATSDNSDNSDEIDVADASNDDEKTETTNDSGGAHGLRSPKTRFAIAVVAALAIVAGSSAFGYSRYIESTRVTVPAAPVAEDFYDSDACAVFKKASLNCEVSWAYSDAVARNELVNQSVAAGERVKKETKVVLSYSNGPAESDFPDIVGKNVDAAVAELYELGIHVSDVKLVDSKGKEADLVVSSSIKSGTTVTNGTEVSLEVSNGKVTIPDWKGKTREAVTTSAKKLNISVTFKEEENEGASGIVLSQSPSPGETAASTEVVVTVSKAFKSKDIEVPDIIGRTAEEAQVELAIAGFRHIKTVTVKNSEVTEKQVTQVVPSVGQIGKSEENIVIIVSEPSE